MRPFVVIPDRLPSRGPCKWEFWARLSDPGPAMRGIFARGAWIRFEPGETDEACERTRDMLRLGGLKVWAIGRLPTSAPAEAKLLADLSDFHPPAAWDFVGELTPMQKRYIERVTREVFRIEGPRDDRA